MADPSGFLGYDLVAPSRVLTPAWTPLRFSPAEIEANERRAQAERRETERRVARELAAAMDEWRQYSDRHYANRVAHAAFDIHQPEAGYDTVVCSECEEHNGYEDTRQVEWPCNTYAAMKGAADG